MSEREDTYQRITDQIIESLEAGAVPWRKPWTASADGPRNAITNRPYRGINVWLLLMAAQAKGYSDPRWITFKAAQKAGGMVRKGQKGTSIVFWDMRRKTVEENGETKTKTIPLLRYYYVFNVEQVDGLKLKPLSVPKVVEPIEAAAAIVDGYNGAPPVSFGGDVAAYSPSADVITVPRMADFASVEAFYATLFHEFTHSTGHASRLNRPGIMTFDHFGSDRYGREELVAELGAAFLSGEAGISPAVIDNNAAYLASWIRTLKEDNRAVVVAAGAAQKAADYILGRNAEKEEEQAA